MPGYLLRTRGVTCRSRYKNLLLLLPESRTELCNSEYESACDGPTRRYESEDRRPDWVRERGRELGQKIPTRDPHEGPSRTEFRLWARSYM